MRTVKILGSIGTAIAALSLVACGQKSEVPPTPAATTTQETPQEVQPVVAAQFATAPLIDPNTATEAELSAIEGLSPAAIQAVLNGRPFVSPTALHAAIGAGLREDQQYAIYSAMFVKVNINTAAAADLQLVPSTLAPGKLAREIEEYRPYKSVDDFSREMQKYVSAGEVAFLQRFVTLE